LCVRLICLKIMFEEADEPSSDIEESAALAFNCRKIERKVQKGVQRLRESQELIIVLHYGVTNYP
jgi:hypothetical protein